jgi:hypothetical protein
LLVRCKKSASDLARLVDLGGGARYCSKMRTLPRLIINGLLFLWIDSAGLLTAQSATPELLVQRADSGSCEHAAFSHDGQLFATDNGDEVLLWDAGTGRLLNTMKTYLSPEIKHMSTGATLMGSARAKGTAVFSPDDKIVAVLPVDFANPLNFGAAGAPSLWRFPRSAVGAVVGIGGMAGCLGSAPFAFFAGHILQLTRSYMILFSIASSAYLLALIVLYVLAPGLKKVEFAA